MNLLVSPQWLIAHLKDPNTVIIDCRFTLGMPNEGKEEYAEGHIPGAVYFDLEDDWSSSVTDHGGRHPLPDVGELTAKLGTAGISPQTNVVLYDDQKGCMAARGYWLLKYLGHKQAALLDGGYSAWVKAGGHVTHGKPIHKAVSYVPDIQPHMLRSVTDVREALGSPNTALIDSRAMNRFTGENETMDPIGGHIPGACQYDWQEAVNEDGTWKSPEELRERYKGLAKHQEWIVYCGSGVTACANLYAMELAGYNNGRLYAGSWSDWITYPDNPVATGVK
ncbi:sulfurtransferase [Aneurinibacillus sp. Ricciae_BoGa-3]|uniref:sulfurtransferase n=1 Tax=Aneurinibacillus sp. Ricciae_BoGa-3 TaxID=3022697 RepID=UPI0023406B74|nr:sulfurtransferase [Aneurinibacillus sp. Ricciae_BoGa-3]WCK56132.1 sulfurtransferase [Aneurinibacillus sp. Ricciae_BoGa-3]